jgi:RNA polymerase primary sigma factor
MARTRTPAQTRDRTRTRGEHTTSSASTRTDHRVVDHARPDVETTDSFQLFLNQASRYPLLTAEEEIDLAQRIERGDLEAKDRLVNSNLRLVVSIARRYQGFGLPLQDLVQEAMLGLIRAAEKFDWRRGYKFSTYATLWIRQAIQRGLDNTSRPIRVPANVAQQLRNLHRTEAELTAKLDHEPSDDEIAAHSKFSAEEVAVLRDLSRVTTSLDATIADSETTLGDLRADETPAPEEDVIDRQREEAIEDALERLPDRERRVLEMRFGTGGEAETTLRDIGRRLGITQERARQLETRALQRLAENGALEAWREAA